MRMPPQQVPDGFARTCQNMHRLHCVLGNHDDVCEDARTGVRDDSYARCDFEPDAVCRLVYRLPTSGRVLTDS